MVTEVAIIIDFKYTLGPRNRLESIFFVINREIKPIMLLLKSIIMDYKAQKVITKPTRLLNLLELDSFLQNHITHILNTDVLNYNSQVGHFQTYNPPPPHNQFSAHLPHTTHHTHTHTHTHLPSPTTTSTMVFGIEDGVVKNCRRVE